MIAKYPIKNNSKSQVFNTIFTRDTEIKTLKKNNKQMTSK